MQTTEYWNKIGKICLLSDETRKMVYEYVDKDRYIGTRIVSDFPIKNVDLTNILSLIKANTTTMMHLCDEINLKNNLSNIILILRDEIIENLIKINKIIKILYKFHCELDEFKLNSLLNMRSLKL